MDKKMRQELEQYYRAPAPKRKREFTRQYCPRRINLWHMLYIQMRYIPKWVWGSSVLFFLAAWYTERILPDGPLGGILAMMPFLVMVSVAESMRSVTYGMQELEMAAQFSLKSVILARMGIMGFVNLFLITAFLILVGENALENMVFMLVPYLVAAIGNLILVRRIPEKENIYACMGFSVMVSGAQILFRLRFPFLYGTEYGVCWLAAFPLLFAAAAAEGKKTVWRLAETIH